MDGERGETREELLAPAKARGYDVTEHQLARWRREGLLPGPEQHGLGRGYGSRTFYPPDTGKQLLRLCEIHFGDRVKRLPHVGWKLWWEGFDNISLFKPVRALLTRVVAKLDEELTALLDPDTGIPYEDKWEQMMKESREGRLDKPISGMRRRVRRDRMPTLMSIMLEVPLGLYEAFQVGALEGASEDDSDSRLAERAFGLDRGPGGQGWEDRTRPTKNLEITLGEGSRLFREHSPSEVLNSATDEDLRVSRDQVRLLLTSLRIIGVLAEEMSESEAVALREMSKDLRDLEPPDQGLLVLSWTMWRLWGPPGTRAMMDSHHEGLQQAIDQIRGLGWNITDAEE